MILTYQIQNEDSYLTVRDVLKKHFHLSAHFLTQLKSQNRITLNGNVIFPSVLVSFKDVISVSLEDAEDNSNVVPTPMELNIVYEDEGILVLNKPARNCDSSLLFSL